MNTDKFIGSVVAVVVGIIVVTAVAIPVISGVTIGESVANRSAMLTILGILPLMMLIGLLVASIFFVKSRKA